MSNPVSPAFLARVASAALATAILWMAGALAAPSASAQSAKESDCADGIDNDGDGLADCFDADCFGDANCKPGGGLENTDALCSDGIDNDGDGFVDCEDNDCYGQLVRACKGSWDDPALMAGNPASEPAMVAPSTDMPTLEPGMTVRDLIGTGGDIDGERNDYVCSDGYDNDGDGMIDCEDFGCRFDPEVTVCAPQVSGLRFSVWAHVMASWDETPRNDDLEWDVQFNRVQLRSFGEIPFVQDSFFLISIRAERTPRLTFATFSFPLGGGHNLNINSGGGGLSNGLILGTQKNLLLDRAFYLYSAFEPGNGAAVEFNGPIVPGKLEYRVFGAGGGGNFNGNIGGRFFRGDNFNFAWATGAQIGYFPIGRFDRWDTRFITRPVPTGLGLYLGARYDQRADERFTAANFSSLFRTGRLLFTTEAWAKREFNFESWQFSYNATIGFLAIKEWLMFGADFGQFHATDFENLPNSISDLGDLPQDVRRQTNQTQWRVAAHFFAYGNNAVISALYTDALTENFNQSGSDRHERQVRLEARMGF